MTRLTCPNGADLGTVPHLPTGIAYAFGPWMLSLPCLSPAAHSFELIYSSQSHNTSQSTSKGLPDPDFPVCPQAAYHRQLLWQGESHEKPSKPHPFLLFISLSPCLSINQPFMRMQAPVCSSTWCFLPSLLSRALFPVEHCDFSSLKNVAQRAVSLGLAANWHSCWWELGLLIHTAVLAYQPE